jgi:hypothetical protein
MQAKDVRVLRVKLYITLPVVCEKCGKQGRTTPIPIEVSHTSLDALQDMITSHPNTRIGTNFPVGWAGHGTYYHCPDCVG